MRCHFQQPSQRHGEITFVAAAEKLSKTGVRTVLAVPLEMRPHTCSMPHGLDDKLRTVRKLN